MTLDVEPSLVRHLAQLKVHMDTIQGCRHVVAGQMTEFKETTQGLSQQARDLNERLGGLQAQLANMESAKKTVVKVADRFNDLKKAERVLNEANPDLPKLLATYDSLREADRFAVTLDKRGGATSSSKGSQSAQTSKLLTQALEMVDSRFRSMVTQLARIEFDQYARDPSQAPEFMSPKDLALFKQIAARLNAPSHLREFSEQMSEAIEESYVTFTFAALRGTEFYTPGTHPLLRGLAFYRCLLTAAQRFARAVYPDGQWEEFQDALAADRKDGQQHLIDFSAIALVRRSCEAAIRDVADNCRVYVTLDLARDFCQAHWKGVVPSAGGAQRMSALGEMNSLKSYLATQVVQLLNNYCVTTVVHDDDDDAKKVKTPSDGSILVTVINAGHLLIRLTNPKVYGVVLFEQCLAWAPDMRMNFSNLEEYMTCIVQAVVDDVKQRAEYLRKEKKRRALATIFALNNLHYLYHHLGGKDADVVYPGRKQLQQEYLSWKKAYIEASWGAVCQVVCEHRRGEGSEHRQWVKDCFRRFNKGVEDCLAEGKDIVVPNAALKQELFNSIHRYIAEPYRRFVSAYQGANFSKSPDKYILYREREGTAPLAQMLRRLFKNS
eukprot:TRINITY_DN19168_c0_g1_i1.p1 TRINITY_DN19168_c0_g1~~TRINITY_DN19168_c0_g1_i1.p1  ORF type:complete len:608 (+),score=216.51 TRINITY_DN19168_c0_g1_i1:98-1921(+)